MDYILTNKVDIVKNTEVLKRLRIGSDLRMLRTTIRVNTKLERNRMVRPTTPRVNIQCLLQGRDKFQLELQNRFEMLDIVDDVEQNANNFMTVVNKCALETAGRAKSKKKEKLNPPTKVLLRKRREMISEGRARDNIKYVETCKTIREKMRDEHNTNMIKTAVERGK